MAASSKHLAPTSRRAMLQGGAGVLGGMALTPTLLALAGCEDQPFGAAGASRSAAPGPPGAVRSFTLTAEPGETVLASGRRWRTWLYNGGYPGPEIRVREGERLRIAVENRLEEGTTVHWHGIPVPNGMDGVPGLTQAPIPPGETMVYAFEAGPAGSYMYHSHAGLQLDRGLLGPLVIEERTPHVDYDSDHLVIIDDFLPAAPRPLDRLAEGRGGRGMMGGRMRRGRGMGRGMMGGLVPPYAGHLINGRPPEDPAEIVVRRGGRARLRLINPAGATSYRVAIAGHRMIVSHADGRPVEPVAVDSLTIGMGERYDVMVETREPGLWPIAAAPIEGAGRPARAWLRYADAAASSPRQGLPAGLREGRRLSYADLRSVETLPAPRAPDRRFDLRLSGGMMMRPDIWTIDGEAWPDAPPLSIAAGETVRVTMVNHSMMLHPMHLHGHFFRAGNALKDTILVAPHMGRASFDFVADNPGRWLFHCHNVYHMEAGMAREIRYR